MRYCFQDQVGNIWQGAEGAEFGEMTRVDILPSSVAPHHRRRSPPNDHQRPPYQPLSTEPSRPTADRPTRSYRTLFPFPLLSSSFSGIWSSRRDRDSRFVQKNVRKAHHLQVTDPSLARVTGKRERRDGRLDGDDGRSKISKKSIQTSIVTLSRRVSARLPFFRVKSLQPVKISHKNISLRSAGKSTKGINSRFAPVSSRGKPISILRRLKY